MKSTRTAVKKAKQYELQRHVRRLKQTRSAGEPTATAEEELAIIKALDVQAGAMRALVSKLTKSNLIPRASAADLDADETLQRFPLLPHAEAEQLTHGTVPSVDQLARGTGADTARVERVCHQVLSSKVLADELASCIKSLSAMVKPAVAEEAKSSHQEEDAESKDVDENEDAGDGANEDVDGASDVHGADQDNSEASEGEEPRDAPEYSDSDDAGPSYANLDAMVAGGSDSEEVRLFYRRCRTDPKSSDESDEDEPRRPKRRRESESPTSEFLPSLATGFIPAKPGEDWSEGEVEFADTGAKGPAKSMRKNRRGQRERRAYVLRTELHQLTGAASGRKSSARMRIISSCDRRRSGRGRRAVSQTRSSHGLPRYPGEKPLSARGRRRNPRQPLKHRLRKPRSPSRCTPAGSPNSVLKSSRGLLSLRARKSRLTRHGPGWSPPLRRIQAPQGSALL